MARILDCLRPSDTFEALGSILKVKRTSKKRQITFDSLKRVERSKILQEVRGMKLLGLLTIALLISACGKDSKNDNNQVAQVPAYGAGETCVQNGGYGCSYSNYPQGFTQYPTNNNYYAGYNYNCGAYQSCGYSYTSGVQYFSACPAGTVAAYSPYYGLGCVQAYQPVNYYFGQSNYYAYYSYGGYYALTYCTTTMTACGTGQVCQTGGQVYGFCTYR